MIYLAMGTFFFLVSLVIIPKERVVKKGKIYYSSKKGIEVGIIGFLIAVLLPILLKKIGG